MRAMLIAKMKIERLVVFALGDLDGDAKVVGHWRERLGVLLHKKYQFLRRSSLSKTSP